MGASMSYILLCLSLWVGCDVSSGFVDKGCSHKKLVDVKSLLISQPNCMLCDAFSVIS